MMSLNVSTAFYECHIFGPVHQFFVGRKCFWSILKELRFCVEDKIPNLLPFGSKFLPCPFPICTFHDILWSLPTSSYYLYKLMDLSPKWKSPILWWQLSLDVNIHHESREKHIQSLYTLIYKPVTINY